MRSVHSIWQSNRRRKRKRSCRRSSRRLVESGKPEKRNVSSIKRL